MSRVQYAAAAVCEDVRACCIGWLRISCVFGFVWTTWYLLTCIARGVGEICCRTLFCGGKGKIDRVYNQSSHVFVYYPKASEDMREKFSPFYAYLCSAASK